MTWDQVRSLRQAGMDIGSHCRSHRVLTTVAPSELDRELTGSRQVLERELGEEIRTVAYPVGRSILGHPQIVGAVRSADYRLGFANESGSSMAHRWSNPLDIGRIPMDRGLLDETFRSVVAFPPLLRLPIVVDALSRSIRGLSSNGLRKVNSQ